MIEHLFYNIYHPIATRIALLYGSPAKIFYSKNKKCQTGGVKKIGSACSDSGWNNEKNENLGFVTNKENSKKILRFQMSYKLIRQLGHAFNCQEDPVIDILCSPGDINKTVGNYVMNPKLSSASMPNNWKLSICCLRKIKALVTKKVYCFKNVERSTYGNGIVEEGESCECGSSGSCLSEKSCCIPKDKPFQCSLKKNTACWPESDQCCHISCVVLHATNKIYSSNEPYYNASTTCNGEDPLCPGKLEPDTSPCFGTSQTCKNGKCISNVCEDHGLQLCECSSI